MRGVCVGDACVRGHEASNERAALYQRHGRRYVPEGSKFILRAIGVRPLGLRPLLFCASNPGLAATENPHPMTEPAPDVGIPAA